MQLGTLYKGYRGRILREWRDVRARNQEANDLLALLYIEGDSVVISLVDRKFAVEELGITKESRNQLTIPAEEADPPVPLALWVLLINAQGNETVRLVDTLSQGGSA